MRWLLLFVPLVTWADGGHGHNHHDDGDVTIDSTMVSRDDSKAFGIGGADVDINDYYRSFGNAFWTDTRPNLLALAAYLDSVGNYDGAAELRCSVRKVRRALGGKSACLALVRATERPPPIVEDQHFEEEQEYHEEQQELYEDLLAKVRNLEQVKQRPIVKREVVEQRIGLSDEQKIALREVTK